MTLRLTKQRIEVLLIWAKGNKEADLDEYRRRPSYGNPYDFSLSECRIAWDGIIKDLKMAKRNLKYQGEKK